MDVNVRVKGRVNKSANTLRTKNVAYEKAVLKDRGAFRVARNT